MWPVNDRLLIPQKVITRWDRPGGRARIQCTFLLLDTYGCQHLGESLNHHSLGIQGSANLKPYLKLLPTQYTNRPLEQLKSWASALLQTNWPTCSMWHAESNFSGGSRLFRPSDLDPRHRDCSPGTNSGERVGPERPCTSSVRWRPCCPILWEADVFLFNCWRLRFANEKIKTPPPGNYGQSNHRLWEERWCASPPLSPWVSHSPLSSRGPPVGLCSFSTPVLPWFLPRQPGRLGTLSSGNLCFFLPSFSQKTYHFTVPVVSTVLDTMKDKSGDSSVRSLLNERNQGSQLGAALQD